MATRKITDLTNVTSVKDTDLLLVETSEGTRSVSKSGLLGGAVMHPYNLLDNSDFRNPIASNGFGNNKSFPIDRWQNDFTYGKFTQNADGIKIEYETNHAYFRQFIKNADKLMGKTLTFAVCLTNGTIRCISGVLGDGKPKEDALYDNTGFYLNDGGSVLIVVFGGSVSMRWAALYEGEYTPETLPAYVPKGKMAEMINCGIPLQPKNLLDNSYFVNPVNQRGKTSYNTNGYTIDRWTLVDGAGNGVSVTNKGITIHACNNLVVFKQMIPSEVRKSLIGKCVTLIAVASDGEVIMQSAIVPEIGVQLDPSENYFSTGLGMDIYCFTGEETLSVRFLSNGLSKDTTIVWAALYEGVYTADTIPSYIAKGYAVERAECRRYYRRYNIDNLSALGYTHGGYLYWAIQFDDEMQSEPLLIETSKVSYITSNDTSFHTTDEVSEMYNAKKGRIALRVPCQVSDFETAFVTPVDVIGLSADL